MQLQSSKNQKSNRNFKFFIPKILLEMDRKDYEK
jgi:hypothetical protein